MARWGRNGRARPSRAAGGEQRAIADGLSALDAALAQLWKSIRAGDVLDAEVQASELLALPGFSDDNDESHATVAAGLIGRGARALAPPEQAAFLRLLVALGTKAVKRQASEDLADLADDEVYPPEWVTRIGKAVPGRAYRARDAFGDQELVAVTFSYDDAEHVIMVATRPRRTSRGVHGGAEQGPRHVSQGNPGRSRFRRSPGADHACRGTAADRGPAGKVRPGRGFRSRHHVDVRASADPVPAPPPARAGTRRGRSRTPPPAGRPPWPSSRQARSPPRRATRTWHGSGPRCSPGTAAGCRRSARHGRPVPAGGRAARARAPHVPALAGATRRHAAGRDSRGAAGRRRGRASMRKPPTPS